jgi:hypothetical protein
MRSFKVLRTTKFRERIMQINLRTACLAAVVIVSSTALANAQNATDSNGNANGSQHIGNGAGATAGAMHSGSPGTTGINNSQSARDNPNGSPGGAPKAKAGPQGDPSKKEDAPK